MNRPSHAADESASRTPRRLETQSLANTPYVSEPFGDFPALGPAWGSDSDPFDPFPQSDQTGQPAHDERAADIFLAADDDDVEDDDLFDDDDDDLLDDDEEDDDDDDFFDDDDDDFDDDDEEEDEDDDSYFFGDDDD